MSDVWQVVRRLARWTCVAVIVSACRPAVPREARAVPNDNRAPAGLLRDGVLTLHLEAREARWYPDGEGAPSIVMQFFAEAGKEPQNPGPLIRVAAGTTIRVSVRNSLHDSTLVIYGLATRPSPLDDTNAGRAGPDARAVFRSGRTRHVLLLGIHDTPRDRGPKRHRQSVARRIHRRSREGHAASGSGVRAE